MGFYLVSCSQTCEWVWLHETGICDFMQIHTSQPCSLNNFPIKYTLNNQTQMKPIYATSRSGLSIVAKKAIFGVCPTHSMRSRHVQVNRVSLCFSAPIFCVYTEPWSCIIRLLLSSTVHVYFCVVVTTLPLVSLPTELSSSLRHWLLQRLHLPQV